MLTNRKALSMRTPTKQTKIHGNGQVCYIVFRKTNADTFAVWSQRQLSDTKGLAMQSGIFRSWIFKGLRKSGLDGFV